MHHHILPPDYLSAVAAAGITAGGGRDFPEWSPDVSLALMDRHGIEKAIVSISSPGLYFGDPGAARDLARLCNEYSAQLIRDNPGRFGAFAALPLPDIDASLTELAYALDVLGLQGACLLTNYGGAYLGNPQFAGLFDELSRRKCVVFVHPDVPPGSDSLGLSAPAFMVEFVIDTTRTVSDLLFSGTLERCPGHSIHPRSRGRHHPVPGPTAHTWTIPAGSPGQGPTRRSHLPRTFVLRHGPVCFPIRTPLAPGAGRALADTLWERLPVRSRIGDHGDDRGPPQLRRFR